MTIKSVEYEDVFPADRNVYAEGEKVDIIQLNWMGLDIFNESLQRGWHALRKEIGLDWKEKNVGPSEAVLMQINTDNLESTIKHEANLIHPMHDVRLKSFLMLQQNPSTMDVLLWES